MKKVIAALGLIVVLVVVAIAAAVFLTPTDFKVEREVTIAKPRADVFGYAKLLKNQNEWGPWTKRDPNIKLKYTGNDGEVGFISAWESQMDDVGFGEQEIKKIEDGKRIDFELRFKKPFESKSDAFMTFEDSGAGQTKVRWGFSGSMPRPFNLMLLFTDMDKELGKDFDAGLSNLKNVVEKSGGN